MSYDELNLVLRFSKGAELVEIVQTNVSDWSVIDITEFWLQWCLSSGEIYQRVT